MLRRATKADQALIRRMVVREGGLDPTSLHWSHFVLAEVNGEVAGLGQIRPYRNCPELGSIYTRPQHRGVGVAAAIIRRLIADCQALGPVYLECRAHMASYYRQFGFEEIRWQQAPMPLKLKSGIGAFFARLFGLKLAVMRLNRDQSLA